MKNRSIEIVKSKVKLRIAGKNVNRYLLRLSKNHISLLSIHKISKDECSVLIYFKDYELAQKLNTIYNIHIVEYGGWEKEKKSLGKNKWLILSLLVAVLFLFFVSRLIFKVEIVTNDQEMKNRLTKELRELSIDKYHFQKSYQELQEIKAKLLEIHHDDIEWLEIERVGTKYRIRFEPRIIEPSQEKTGYRHLISKKNAIVKKVESSSGQILREKNDYVKKGDIIVSGYISLNGTVKETVSAIGTVYGEVWYEVEVFYPFGYYEQTKTGKKKEVFVLEFLSHRLELFNFSPFYDKITNSTTLLEKRGFPIRFSKELQEEVNTISSIETVEEATLKAVDLAHKKIEAKLSEKEHVLKYKIINREIENNGVRLKVFFSVYEDITDYLEITPYVEEKNEGDAS